MKIRSEEDFQDIIDKEFAWRRKELSIIHSNVKSSKNKNIATSIRAGLTILYAHWEGFIKNTAQYYLQYVATKKIKYNEITTNFIAIKLKQKLTECEHTNKASIHTQVIDFLINGLNEKAQIPFLNIIHTSSNLNSEVFKEILLIIGLDYAPYETKQKLINEQLLKQRNEIAHGEYLIVNKEEFDAIYTGIINIMSSYKNEVLNLVTLKKYLK